MQVFVYGTLTDPEQVARVCSTFEFRGAATLDGLRRVEGEYPTLAPGGAATGRLLETPEIEELDAYEGVERGLYVRVSVPLADGSGGSADRERDERDERVELYVGDPAALGADAEWPGSGSFAERVRRFCRENEVAVRRSGRG
ncbi:gamma-glutamylcyclotransferase family protein [Halorussus salinus]|uniref:gamma-glutamylcyclotransferase family protein n=1 Tax=Halorussus salinus TaxID=1364935 RepID=UPI0010921A9C|nr:gamma-glutamylcyclotransferase family protein [Halorussus salinus]